MRRSASLLVTVLSLTLVGCGTQSSEPSAGSVRDDRASLAEQPVEPGAELRREPHPQLARALSPEGPAVAQGPRQVAAQLTVADQVLADPGAPTEEVAAAGHLQQVAYLELGPRPGWDDRVLAAVPEELRPDVRDNVASRREFLRLHGTTSHRTLPAWRIVEPAPADELRSYYDLAEERYGVPWEYLASINLVETGLGRIQGLSVAGARGPMQFMPATWAAYGEGDIDSPRDSILSAGRYLAEMGFDRDRDRALRLYNNADTYVRGVTRVAQVLERDPDAFTGYHHWQVYYQTARGTVRLPTGYDQPDSVPLGQWLDTEQGQTGLPFRATP